jgi:hypothetical protein
MQRPQDYFQQLTFSNLPTYQNESRVVRFRQALRNAAAISLAARLYQSDHNGAWPGSLEALAPDYLPSIPIDPLSPEQKPFRYELRDDGKRPILLGVGYYAASAAAENVKLPGFPLHGSIEGSQAFVWDLSHFEPTTPFVPSEPYAETQRRMDGLAATTSGISGTDNQPDQPDEEGKDQAREQSERSPDQGQ